MKTDSVKILKRIENYFKYNSLPQYLSLKDIKEKTTLSDSTIRRAIRLGQLTPVNHIGKKLFRPADVVNWIENR